MQPPDTTQRFAAARSRLRAQVQTALAGRYRIVRELGHGGMAVAYLAENLDFQRLVAIKVLRPDKGYEDGAVERFRTEAVAVAQLQHPHVIGIHARGEEGELLWFEMNFVDGGSLHDKIKAGPIAPEAAARYIAQAADALAYAHGRGIIHRDIKPSNLLIAAATDHLVVTDFGIAKILGNSSLTETGITVGTFAYMSPEQLAADPNLTFAADQYSLGVVAYQCITGVVPFDGMSPGKLIAAQVQRPVPAILKELPTCPPDLAALIERMLAPLPDNRWDNMLVVKRAADEIALTGQAQSLRGIPAPLRVRRSRRRRLAAGVLVAGAVLIGGVFLARRSRDVPLNVDPPAAPAAQVTSADVVGPAATDTPPPPTPRATNHVVAPTHPTTTDAHRRDSAATVPPARPLADVQSSAPGPTVGAPAALPPAPLPTTGVLEVTSKLPGTFLYVAGHDREPFAVPTDRFIEIPVTAGRVHLRISSNQPGCTDREDDVTISPGEHKKITRNANCPE